MSKIYFTQRSRVYEVRPSQTDFALMLNPTLQTVKSVTIRRRIWGREIWPSFKIKIAKFTDPYTRC